MTGSTRPVDPAAVISRLSRRVDILERRLRSLETQFKPEVTFSYDGPLSVASSPLWRRREKGRLIGVVGSLVTAGSTATQVEVLKNGAVVGTLTIQADQTYGQLHLSVSFAPDADTLQDQITVAGAGAEGLTVQHRWAASTS